MAIYNYYLVDLFHKKLFVLPVKGNNTLDGILVGIQDLDRNISTSYTFLTIMLSYLIYLNPTFFF